LKPTSCGQRIDADKKGVVDVLVKMLMKMLIKEWC
jgi:hypothetical protein